MSLEVAPEAGADAAPDVTLTDAATDAGAQCDLPGKFGDDACQACVATKCCSVIAACGANADCAAMLQCTLDCEQLGVDAPACYQQCQVDHAAGNPQFQSMVYPCWYNATPPNPDVSCFLDCDFPG